MNTTIADHPYTDAELLDHASNALASLDRAPVFLNDERIGTTHAVLLSSQDSSTSHLLDESNIHSIIRDFPDVCELGSFGGAFGNGYWLIVQVVNDETVEAHGEWKARANRFFASQASLDELRWHGSSRFPEDSPVENLTTDMLHPQFGRICSILQGLAEDYPVYDEADFSGREHEDAIETLVHCYGVPSELAGDVFTWLFDTYSICRSEEISSGAVEDAFVDLEIQEDDDE